MFERQLAMAGLWREIVDLLKSEEAELVRVSNGGGQIWISDFADERHGGIIDVPYVTYVGLKQELEEVKNA